MLLEGMPMTFDKLERSMQAYMDTPASMESPDEITFDALPIVEDTPAEIAAAMSGDTPSVQLRGVQLSRHRPKTCCPQP